MTTTTVMFFAIGPHCWGKGPTKAEAVKQMRKHWPTFVKDAKYVIYQGTNECSVTPSGLLQYPKDQPAPVLLSQVTPHRSKTLKKPAEPRRIAGFPPGQSMPQGRGS